MTLKQLVSRLAGLGRKDRVEGGTKARGEEKTAARCEMESLEERELLSFSASVNFQPRWPALPAGYTKDIGRVYGDRGNGFTYGWSADATAAARDFGRISDERYDTAIFTQWGGNKTWEIAVPNGIYNVRVMAGDPLYTDGIYKFNVEGKLLVNGTPTYDDRWVEGRGTVAVTDGRLTISNAAGARNNRIDYVNITTAKQSRLWASGVSQSQVNLTWEDTTRVASGYRIERSPDGLNWAPVATVAGNVRTWGNKSLSAATRYFYRVGILSGSTVVSYTNTAAGTTTAGVPSSSNVGATYKTPITITRGGTYTGNWASDNPNVAAVTIATSEPVTILNSNIRSRGMGIWSIGYNANVTVRNTRGYGLNPNEAGRYAGRFLALRGFVNVVVENNYMSGMSGIYLDGYRGNHSKTQTVKVFRNQARNIDGRYSNGAGGYMSGPEDNFYVQFFQINGVHDLTGAEVAWNEVVNQAARSRVEDNISIHDSSGTAASPFLLHDNYIQGAYPADVLNDTSYSGGGIMLSDNGSSFVRAYNNQVISTSNYGIAISSGHDNAFYNNRIISSGYLGDALAIASQNVGAYIWNQDGLADFYNNVGYNNVIGWLVNGDRNDTFIPDATDWSNNTEVGGTITPATEVGEWSLWKSKLNRAGVSVGAV